MLDLYTRVTELEQALSNTIRYGVIKSVDTANNYVVVDFGNQSYSPKLPYLVNSSGNAKVFFVPKVGDQVIVLSPGGAITGAVCIPAIYKGNVSGVEDEWRLEFAKGSLIYKQGELTIASDNQLTINTKTAEVKASEAVNIQSKKATIKADSVILSDESGGGVVCQNHLCAFTGGPHPQGSSKVKGAR